MTYLILSMKIANNFDGDFGFDEGAFCHEDFGERSQNRDDVVEGQYIDNGNVASVVETVESLNDSVDPLRTFAIHFSAAAASLTR